MIAARGKPARAGVKIHAITDQYAKRTACGALVMSWIPCVLEWRKVSCSRCLGHLRQKRRRNPNLRQWVISPR